MAAALTTDCLFFFNDTATTEFYTLSLHDALQIYLSSFKPVKEKVDRVKEILKRHALKNGREDRKTHV